MLQVEVTASYQLGADERQCCHHTLELPMAMFAQLVPPIKNAAARLTLCLDSAPPSLLDMFSDVVQASASEASAV